MNLKTTLIITLVVLMGSFTILTAQNDVILKTDGQEMVGRVTEMNATDLKFAYQNETVEYTVPKSEIVKISFASGRIEFMEGSKPPSQTTQPANTNLGEHHNKVAILPFAYIRDQGDGSTAMAQKIQTETYSIFNKKKVNLKYQDPNTTNTLLVKAGVVNNNTTGYTMGEICDILGVEYLVQGTVSVEKTGQSTYSSTSVSGKSKSEPQKKEGLIGSILSTSGTASTSSHFITAFKKKFGTTPKKFLMGLSK